MYIKVHIIQCTLDYVHYTMYIRVCLLYMVHRKQNYTKSIYTIIYTCNKYSCNFLYAVLIFAVYHTMLYKVLCTVYVAVYVYNYINILIHRMYIGVSLYAYIALYNVHCTVYSVHCIVYI